MPKAQDTRGHRGRLGRLCKTPKFIDCSKARTRLSLVQMIEVLALLKQTLYDTVMAERYKISASKVSNYPESRASLEAGGRSAARNDAENGEHNAGFPEGSSYRKRFISWAAVCCTVVHLSLIHI